VHSRDRLLVRVYALIAVVALIATWSQNIRFFLQEDNGGLVGFVEACYASAPAASITNDVLLMVAAAWVLMAVEARRLRIPHLWAYFVLSGLVAISVTFPVFLAVRQHRIGKLRAAGEGGGEEP